MTKTKKIIGIPEPTVRRMPTYLHYLKELNGKGGKTVSAPQIASALRFDATQVTKDLSYTGVTGRPRIGYNLAELINAVEDFLGVNRNKEAFLVGVGNLGTALLRYPGFSDLGLKIIAGFDTDYEKTGKEIEGIPVFHIDKFRDLVERLHITIGIVTTPPEVAQQTVDLMIGWGIKAVWNFTPVAIRTPKHIIVQNTSIYSNLALLMNKIKQQSAEKRAND